MVEGILVHRRKNSSNCKSKGKNQIGDQIASSVKKTSAENIRCGGLPLVIDSPKQFPEILE